MVNPYNYYNKNRNNTPLSCGFLIRVTICYRGILPSRIYSRCSLLTKFVLLCMQRSMKFQEGNTKNKVTQHAFHSILEGRHKRMRCVNITFKKLLILQEAFKNIKNLRDL